MAAPLPPPGLQQPPLPPAFETPLWRRVLRANKANIGASLLCVAFSLRLYGDKLEHKVRAARGCTQRVRSAAVVAALLSAY